MAKAESAGKGNALDTAGHSATFRRTSRARSGGAWPKKILFAFLPTLVLLSVLEASLWIFGYESPVADPYESFVLRKPLFVANEVDGLTTAFPRRKFFHTQSFTVTKRPSTRRIFVFGGSTTYGYALDDPIRDGYVSRLGNMLARDDPRHTYEMINCGGIAYASYRLVDLVEECLAYGPDLVIIMSGHNEFVEARYYTELKSVDSLIQRTWYKLRTVRLLAHVSNSIKAKTYEGTREEQSLLHDNPHVGERYIVRDAAEFEHTLEHYTRNLNRMIDACQANNTPVVVCTCPSNLLDHPPFESEPPSGMTRGEYYNLTARAWRLFEDGNIQESLAITGNILQQGPHSAAAHYISGKCYYDLGDLAKAKQSFILAKDTDSFPKRALTHFNERVREIARLQGIPLFDGEELYFDEAENGIPGRGLFLDDCHPTQAGHQLFAQALSTIARAIFDTDELDD